MDSELFSIISIQQLHYDRQFNKKINIMKHLVVVILINISNPWKEVEWFLKVL